MPRVPQARTLSSSAVSGRLNVPTQNPPYHKSALFIAYAKIRSGQRKYLRRPQRKRRDDSIRNLLDRYESVRNTLWKTLREDVQEEINLSCIKPIEIHPSGDRGEGIPDLVIRGHDFILVIEIKVKKERGLQPAQQEAYVPWIQKAIQEDEQTGFVTFLIPADYHHWEELEAQSDEDDQGGRVRILPPIYWNQFVEELGLPEELENELIREFYNHLSERFIPKPVKCTTEEVCLMNSKETASGISKLMNIVEQVKDKLKSSGFQVSKLNPYNYGYHLEGKVYFGIWWHFWAKEGFPLYVAIEENQSLQVVFRDHYKNRDKNRVLPFEDDEKYLVAGYMPEPCVDCNALIETIVTDIETLLRKDDSEESSEDAGTP